MKRTAVALSLVLCFGEIATAQSLAEIAKKEKERRKANSAAGKKAVVEAEGVGKPLTEEEKLALQEREEKELAAREEREKASAEAGKKDEERKEQERKEAEKERQKRVEQADAYEARLKQIRKDYRDALRDCPDTITAGGDDQMVVDNYGRQVGTIRDRNPRTQDSQACGEKAELRSEYARLYQKLLLLDAVRVLNIPSTLR